VPCALGNHFNSTYSYDWDDIPSSPADLKKCSERLEWLGKTDFGKQSLYWLVEVRILPFEHEHIVQSCMNSRYAAPYYYSHTLVSNKWESNLMSSTLVFCKGGIHPVSVIRNNNLEDWHNVYVLKSYQDEQYNCHMDLYSSYSNGSPRRLKQVTYDDRQLYVVSYFDKHYVYPEASYIYAVIAETSPVYMNYILDKNTGQFIAKPRLSICPWEISFDQHVGEGKTPYDAIRNSPYGGHASTGKYISYYGVLSHPSDEYALTAQLQPGEKVLEITDTEFPEIPKAYELCERTFNKEDLRVNAWIRVLYDYTKKALTYLVINTIEIITICLVEISKVDNTFIWKIVIFGILYQHTDSYIISTLSSLALGIGITWLRS